MPQTHITLIFASGFEVTVLTNIKVPLCFPEIYTYGCNKWKHDTTTFSFEVGYINQTTITTSLR